MSMFKTISIFVVSVSAMLFVGGAYAQVTPKTQTNQIGCIKFADNALSIDSHSDSERRVGRSRPRAIRTVRIH